MIVVSWIDDLYQNQKEMDEKLLFYNNETLLSKESLIEHFNKENRKIFHNKFIEFQCRKGRANTVN